MLPLCPVWGGGGSLKMADPEIQSSLVQPLPLDCPKSPWLVSYKVHALCVNKNEYLSEALADHPLTARVFWTCLGQSTPDVSPRKPLCWEHGVGAITGQLPHHFPPFPLCKGFLCPSLGGSLLFGTQRKAKWMAMMCTTHHREPQKRWFFGSKSSGGCPPTGHQLNFIPK